jgi:hypothetical protein
VFFAVEEWLPAFLLTVLVELPVVVILLARSGAPPLRVAVIVVVANLATHAAVWFIWTQLLMVGTPAYTVTVEIWAAGVEALAYWAAFPSVPVRRTVLAAVTANLLSFVIGLGIGSRLSA